VAAVDAGQRRMPGHSALPLRPAAPATRRAATSRAAGRASRRTAR
jgi:hypothetical protein